MCAQKTKKQNKQTKKKGMFVFSLSLPLSLATLKDIVVWTDRQGLLNKRCLAHFQTHSVSAPSQQML